jgi:hypothetical protein
MNEKKESKQTRILKREKVLTQLCKERGWNINELTTGQLLFIVNHPDVKNLK